MNQWRVPLIRGPCTNPVHKETSKYTRVALNSSPTSHSNYLIQKERGKCTQLYFLSGELSRLFLQRTHTHTNTDMEDKGTQKDEDGVRNDTCAGSDPGSLITVSKHQCIDTHINHSSRGHILSRVTEHLTHS